MWTPQHPRPPGELRTQVYTFLLTPTAAGAAIDASGRVEIRARGWMRDFEVGMDAAVADGACFMVLANGRPAGTMICTAGAGNLQLRDLEHILPPNGTDPIRHVRRVEIRDSDGTLVLEGWNTRLAKSDHVR